MKKIFYTLMAAGLVLTACNKEFEPAANPQSYEQEAERTLPDAFTVSPVGSINIATAPELIPVATLGESKLPADAAYGKFTLILDETLKLTVDENLCIAKDVLQKAVSDLYGLKPVERTMAARITSSVQIEGQGFRLESNAFQVKAIPEAPVLEEHYYYVGAATGWSTTDKTYELTNKSEGDYYDNPVISVTIPAPVDADGNRVDNWFKIAPGSAFDLDDFWSADFIGAEENGESAYEGKFVVGNAVAQAFNVGPGSEDALYYTITLDLLAQTYEVKALNFPDNLYMIGSEFGGWDWNSDGIVELVPVLHNPDWGAEAEGQFWTVRYFTAGEGFKFCSKREWSGDFNHLDTNEGFVQDGGNCVVETSGLYLVHIDMKRSILHVEPARVYGIGDCFGGWTAGMDDALFKAEGKKLKATTVKGGEVRMYVESEIATSDWWTREFVYFDGKIAYRGNAGDQERVKALAEQTIVLDFNAGTATTEAAAAEEGIKIDGSFDDWADIPEFASSQNSRIRLWKFTFDADNVYFYLKLRGDRLGKKLHITFDTDNDESTGSNFGNMDGSEVKVLAFPVVEGTETFVSGYDANAELNGEANAELVFCAGGVGSDGEGYVELRMSRSALGLPASGTIAVGCAYDWYLTGKQTVTL